MRTERSYSIDILKAICAFFVVYIHATPPGAFWQIIEAPARIAVPIFFIGSGYFYADVIKKNGELRQIRRIAALAVAGNVIYLIWRLVNAVTARNFDFFRALISKRKLLEFVVLNESPIRYHLWYLGAMLYVLVIVLAVNRLRCMKLMRLFTVPLLLAGLVFGKYALVLGETYYPFTLTRNFLFTGIPYFCIGLWIRDGGGQRIQKKTLAWLMAVFCATSVLEDYLLSRAQLNAPGDTYISTTLLAVAAFLFALKCDARDGVLAQIGGRHLTWLYILHPLFHVYIEDGLKRFNLFDRFAFLIPLAVYAVTAAFLLAADRCSRAIAQHRPGQSPDKGK